MIVLAIDVPSYAGKAIAVVKDKRSATSYVISVITAACKAVKPNMVVAAFDCSPEWNRRSRNGKRRDKVQWSVLQAIYGAMERNTARIADHVVPMVEETWEAEDILATIAKNPTCVGMPQDCKVVLMSGNARVRQCLEAGRVVILRSIDNSASKPEWINAASPELPVKPEQMADYLALVGDKDFPGVKGIGDQMATELITKHGSLHEIVANRETLDERTRELLEASIKSGDLERTANAMKLNDNLPLDKAASHRQWRTRIIGDGREAKLVCCCSLCELRGNGRLYGYLHMHDPEGPAMQKINEQMMRHGYYDPYATETSDGMV